MKTHLILHSIYQWGRLWYKVFQQPNSVLLHAQFVLVLLKFGQDIDQV